MILAASAGAVIVGAVILRLGGRAALMSIMGLDMIAEMGIGNQVDDLVSSSSLVPRPSSLVVPSHTP